MVFPLKEKGKPEKDSLEKFFCWQGKVETKLYGLWSIF